MLDELSEEYPCLMEQNILSYLKRYLSYGDKSETVLEYRVYFDVRRNIIIVTDNVDYTNR